MAGTLGISAGSVKTHLHRGLAALRARLGAAVPPGVHRIVFEPAGLGPAQVLITPT
ncbi:MAG TPA: hypothetical protein VG455_05215 [Acidimicrobiales bacterium]|nr:hypothetical protein [Acidimicrobiales bacterium]